MTAATALRIPVCQVNLDGDPAPPYNPLAAGVFAHGSGNSRFTPRNPKQLRQPNSAGPTYCVAVLGTFENAAAPLLELRTGAPGAMIEHLVFVVGHLLYGQGLPAGARARRARCCLSPLPCTALPTPAALRLLGPLDPLELLRRIARWEAGTDLAWCATWPPDVGRSLRWDPGR